MDNKLLQPGTMLRGGTYRVERSLSSGGFGNTYVVTNVSFDETFAMKEFFMKDINLRDGNAVTVSIPGNRTTFDTQRNKFMKEAKRLRKLKNVHVVSVHDLFEENGTTYYIMDFIDGESLSARLKRTGQPLAENEVRDVLDQLLDALDTIHQQGIWHLDLKPANIMMTKEGKALLIDFGASKQMTPGEGVTTSSGLCYTPGYAPIEQIEQNMDKFGPWTDFYALGATLYHLLTLNPLPSPTELMDEGESALQYPPTVSQQMRQLIFRMMQTSRLHRPQSVAEIRALLSGKVKADDETMAVPTTPKSEETQVVAPPSVPKPPKPEPPKPKPAPEPTPIYEEPEKSRPLWPYIAVAAAVVGLLLGVGGFFVSRMLKSDNNVAMVDSVSTVAPDSTASELEALAAVTSETATEAPVREETPAKPEQERTPTTREEPASTRPTPAPEQPVRSTQDQQTREQTTTATATAPVTEVTSADSKVYDVVEQMPSFPGGSSALFSYLSQNIKYPVVAEENGIQGRVIVSFIVEMDGSISNVRVVKSVDPSLDREAQRVVRSMPRWTPGKQRGAPVRVKYTVPVTFRLQ